MASGAEPSPLRAPADLERANAVCPLSTRQGVPQGHPGTKSLSSESYQQWLAMSFTKRLFCQLSDTGRQRRC
jgi:hypothetical protein